jgi:hypothetical protein
MCKEVYPLQQNFTPENGKKNPNFFQRGSIVKKIALLFTVFVGVYVTTPFFRYWLVSYLVQRSFENYGFEGVLIEKIQGSFKNIVLHNVHLPTNNPALHDYSKKDDIFIEKFTCSFDFSDLVTSKALNVCTIEKGKIHFYMDPNSMLSMGQADSLLSFKSFEMGMKKLLFKDCEAVFISPFMNHSIPFSGEATHKNLTLELRPHDQTNRGSLVLKNEPNQALFNLSFPNLLQKIEACTLECSNVSFELAYDKTLKTSSFSLKASDFTLQTPYFGKTTTPVDLNMKGKGNSYDLTFDVHSSLTDNYLLTATGTASVYYRKLSLDFDSFVKELKNFFSDQEAALKNLSGNATFKGSFSIDKTLQSLKGSFYTLLKELSFQIPSQEIEIQNLSSSLRFDSIYPAHTKNVQYASCQTFKMPNFSLDKVQSTFMVNPWAGGLSILDITGNVFDGAFSAHNVQWKEDQNAYEFDINLKKISLEKFLQICQIQDLQAKGSLSGEVLMTYGVKNGFVLKNLHLTSLEEGVLSYKPSEEKTPALNDDTPLKALEDFHYTLLSLVLEPMSKNTDSLSAKIHVIGHNPQVMNGYPFEVSFTSQTSFENIAQQALSHFKLPQKQTTP